jgi:imidazolonepropionase-like amidohydrolase
MRFSTVFVFMLLAACASVQPAPERTSEIRHTFLTTGHRAGTQIETRGADGSTIVRFHFDDRGRGPDITSKTWFGAGEIPERVETRGVDYFKIAVEEDYIRENGKARWKNASEQGEVAAETPAFYLGLNSPPEETAQMIRAALKRPDRRLPVLPSGEVQIVALGTQEVTREGENKTVTLYSISGIDFTPSFLWLDESGKMFAGVSAWSSLILEGWEKNVAVLLAHQQKLARAQLEDFATRLTKRPAVVAFQNVAIFDADAAKLVPDQTVIAAGGKIITVGPAAKTKVPRDAQLIDGRGHTLLPGLWDMHVHVGDTDGILHLAAGVTSVRDLGNNLDELLDTRSRFDAGTLLGPRVMFSGFIDGPGPYALPIGKVVSTEEELRKAIDEVADKGAVQVKLYSSLDPKLIPFAVDQAKKRGLRVSGHVPYGIHASDFVVAGADELQHANFLVLNFLEVPDTRTPERFHAVGREGADLQLSSPKVVAFIELLKQKKTVVDPTLVTFETMFTQRPGEVSRSIAPVDERLPINVRRGYRRGGVAPAGMEARYQAAYTRMMELVAELHRQGVVVVAGTDDIAGFSLHRELELYVQAGIPAAEALKICTLGAAKVMKRDAELGVIAPGRIADLLLVEGDPTQRIEDLRRGTWVMKGGALYQPKELYNAIGVR